MQAYSFLTAGASIPKTAMNACPSSWFSWLCYWSTLGLALTPAQKSEILSAGPGFFVLATGLAVFFLAVAAIQRHMHLELSATSYGSPRRLVTNGIFQHSRNPIYAAFLVPMASLAYFSLLLAVCGTAAYMLAMTSFVIRAEERVLEASFGTEYAAYKVTVPRWLF